MTDKQAKSKKLYRNEVNGVVAGIAIGLAEYFDVDVIIVRLVFLVLLFASAGTIIPIYFLAWIVVPDKKQLGLETKKAPKKSKEKESDSDQKSQNLLGLFLLLLGGYFLLANFGYVAWLNFSKIWPVILIGLGVYLLNKKNG